MNMFEKGDKVESSFVVIYFIEQFALIILTYKFPTSINLWVALFPIVFLTTIALEKVFLKSGFKDQLDGLLNEKQGEKTRNTELKNMRMDFLDNKK